MSPLFRIVSATFLFVLTLSMFTARASDETAAEAWSRIEAGAILIDVRSEKEFEGGHLEGSINIPHTELDAIAEAIGDPEKLYQCLQRPRVRGTQSQGPRNPLNRRFARANDNAEPSEKAGTAHCCPT
jgi:rhodanese-related sulfurtransferase